MRLMWRVLHILIATYIGFALVLYFSRSHLVFYPETGREIIATPDQAGLPYEDIRTCRCSGWRASATIPRTTCAPSPRRC